jgi:HPt (histidine-containing phosphotransfer) domain-containing protein
VSGLTDAQKRQQERGMSERADHALTEAAALLSYQAIVEWATARLDEQPTPDTQVVTFENERGRTAPERDPE